MKLKNIYKNNFNLEGVYIYDTPSGKFWRGDLSAENGIINYLRFKPGINKSENKRYIIPSMVDVHTHGRMGVDFINASLEEFDFLIKAYENAGTLVVMPTVASAPIEEMLNAVKNIKNAGFDGAHIEGRWLNPKRKGAHDEKFLALPSLEELNLFIRAADGIKLHITIAPELDGGEEFIREAVSSGATVAAGHTDMPAAQAYKALEAGVSAFTHVFNAMPSIYHREPGAVAAALNSSAYIEIICDGIHIDPEIIKLAYKIKSRDKIVLVTDSMKSAGLENGVGLTENGVIAGSTVSLIDCLNNYLKFTGADISDAVDAATINPARMAGFDNFAGSIALGKRAAVIEIEI